MDSSANNVKNVVNGYTGAKSEHRLNEAKRKQMQHDIKIYLQQYFKQELGKGIDYTKIIICEDMLIIRGEGFLTEPEKIVAQTPSGKKIIKALRNHVILQLWQHNKKYLEEKLDAKVIHSFFDIEPEKDFWINTVVFDCYFT